MTKGECADADGVKIDSMATQGLLIMRQSLQSSMQESEQPAS